MVEIVEKLWKLWKWWKWWKNSGNGGKGESCKRVQWRNCEMGGIVQSLRVVGVSGSIGGLRPPMSVSIGVK